MGKTRKSGAETRNPAVEARNSGSETRNPSAKTRNSSFMAEFELPELENQMALL